MKHCSGTGPQSNVDVFEAPGYPDPQLYHLHADANVTSGDGVTFFFTKNGTPLSISNLPVNLNTNPENSSFDGFFLMSGAETLGFQVSSDPGVVWEIDFRLVRVLDELEP